MALDEFFSENDPCGKGQTWNCVEKSSLADSASQGMAALPTRGGRSRPSSRGASPNRSTFVSSQAAQASTQVPATTPKIFHPLTRNYSIWRQTIKCQLLVVKQQECLDFPNACRGNAIIQGSKLRLPGYLSGKGSTLGRTVNLITTAAARVRTQIC